LPGAKPHSNKDQIIPERLKKLSEQVAWNCSCSEAHDWMAFHGKDGPRTYQPRRRSRGGTFHSSQVKKLISTYLAAFHLLKTKQKAPETTTDVSCSSVMAKHHREETTRGSWVVLFGTDHLINT